MTGPAEYDKVIAPPVLASLYSSPHTRVPMSLFHDLRWRPAKVLFVCQQDSDLRQIEDALLRANGSDVLEPSSAATPQLRNLNLASFDVIVNLSDYPITDQPDVFLLTMPMDPIEEFVQFLADHFRWAREWKFSEEDETQTTPVPTPAAAPQSAASRAASL